MAAEPIRSMNRFALCARRACGAVLEGGQERFCSDRCAALRLREKQAWGRKGGLVAGERRRAQAQARIAGLTPLEAYRVGYKQGLQSKHYLMRKRRVA